MRDEVVGWIFSPRRDLRREEIAQLLERGNMLRIAALHRLVGRDCENDLASDLRMVALRQPHGAKEDADGDLAGIVIDEFELAALGNAIERAIGDLQRG